MVVQLVQARPAILPVYTTSAPVSSLRGDPDVSAAAAVLGELPAWLRPTVTSVTVPGPDQVTLQLRGGVTVVWGGPGDAAAKTKELAILHGDSRALLRCELARHGGNQLRRPGDPGPDNDRRSATR